MHMLRQLNAAVEFIEANLCAEFDLDAAAGIACVSADSFSRFFSYMTGMTPAEYVRRRRLTLAVDDLRHGRAPIVDIAVKYGYDSAAAFSRAFAKQHGVAPSVYRRHGGSLRIYPPVSFHIVIKGAREMDFRIIELEEQVVYGISRPYEGQPFKAREEVRNSMWAGDGDDVPGQLCEGHWNQPGSTAYDGIWYGVWQEGRYMIARSRADTHADHLEARRLPAGTYAAFTTPRGCVAWEEFPKLFELIFDSWLPASEYRQKCDLAIEVLHLWTDREQRQKNRYFEVWIPVELKDAAPAR